MSRVTNHANSGNARSKKPEEEGRRFRTTQKKPWPILEIAQQLAPEGQIARQRLLGQQFRLVNFTAAPYSYPADIVPIWFSTWLISSREKNIPEASRRSSCVSCWFVLSIVAAPEASRVSLENRRCVFLNGQQNGDSFAPPFPENSSPAGRSVRSRSPCAFPRMRDW